MKIVLTPKAVEKVKEIAAQRGIVPALRVSVVGGGCSGFTYQMSLESNLLDADSVFEFDGLEVYVDMASLALLDGTTIDYLDTLEKTGFKFDNPNAKTTCGCGESFQA
jgi:iron-sulfur cluster assembly accessory protein